MIEQSTLYELCSLLARRSNPDYKFKHKSDWLKVTNAKFICLICNQDFDFFDGNTIMSHGLEHLKEHNLLSLI